MADTRGIAGTRKGDRIKITALATHEEENGLRVGDVHTVEHCGLADRTLYCTVAGSDVALVYSIGDRWTVLREPL